MTEEPRSWVVGLPWPDPPLSMNDSGGRWAKSSAIADVRETAQDVFRTYRPRLVRVERLRITLHWAPCKDRTRDQENPCATLKVLCDALVDVGIIDDDDIWRTDKVMPVVMPPTGRPSLCWLLLEELAALPDAPPAAKRRPWVRGEMTARREAAALRRGGAPAPTRAGKPRGTWPIDPAAVQAVRTADLTGYAGDLRGRVEAEVREAVSNDWAATVAANASRIRRQRR